MVTRQITIIGAGLAGTAVAQCIRSILGQTAKIVLYDSKPRSIAKASHYAISLAKYEIFSNLLMNAKTDAGRIQAKQILADVQATKVDLACRRDGQAMNQVQNPTSVIHGRFVHALTQGLDIRWDHKVKSVSRKDEDKIVIDFENGHSITSDFTIVADGVHSIVRQSLTEKSPLQVLPYVVYNGVKTLDPTEWKEKWFPVFDESPHAIHKHPYRIDLQGLPPDETSPAVLRYTYFRPAMYCIYNLNSLDVDPLYVPSRVKSDARKIPKELYSELSDIGQEWKDPFAELLSMESTKSDKILNWLVRSMTLHSDDADQLAKRGVMLLGDAAHVQSLITGHGANSALTDAVKIAQFIDKHGLEKCKDHIKQYYDENLKLWESEVQESCTALETSRMKPE